MGTEQGRTGAKMASAALLTGRALAGLSPEHARAASYEIDVMLAGTPERSEKISGYRGTPVTLDVVDDEHAIYAISSHERRDNPCLVWIGTENVNESARTTGTFKNLCGGDPQSRLMRAEYRDDMYHGPRVFVTGIRVCTNNKETRVKGFQLRGKRIEDDGGLAALTNSPGPTRLASGGRHRPQRSDHVNDPESPADYRNNCKEWHAWADCPQSHQVAIGLIGHFEAGKEPRSLTGVQLQCRNVSQGYVSARPK